MYSYNPNNGLYNHCYGLCVFTGFLADSTKPVIEVMISVICLQRDAI